MSIKIYEQGFTEGAEESASEHFSTEPVWYQIKVLREEMLDWATGRSKFHPMAYSATNGPYSRQQEYATWKMQSKAIMIDALTKILVVER